MYRFYFTLTFPRLELRKKSRFANKVLTKVKNKLKRPKTI